MIGKETLVLDWRNWAQGMSSGLDISDGGFSPGTRATNLTKEPGVIYAPAARVDSDTDTRLTGEIIASSPDMAVLGGDDRLLVARDSDQDGTFYRYNGTKISAAALSTDTTNNYDIGFTHIITYKGEAYVTTKELIKRWENDNTITNLSSGGFTNTTFPHPAIVFEDNAYYGDGNILLRQTAANGAPVSVLVLPTGNIIMALGIDPGTGKMLISTTSLLNISGTQKGINKLHWYDGSSNKVSKVVIVGDVINSFESVGSTVYVGYGTNLGFINGSGVQFLRTLRNVGNVQDDLPYQNNITSVDNILLVADGRQVLAYGEILPGQRVPWYIVRNEDNSNNIKSIFGVGNHKIGISVEAFKFDTIDLSSIASTSAGGLNFVTNLINFPRPVHIRNLRLEFFSNLSSTGSVTVLVADQEKDSVTLTHNPGVVNNTRIMKDFSGFAGKQDQAQIIVDITSGNAGLKRIIIYYDVAE